MRMSQEEVKEILILLEKEVSQYEQILQDYEEGKNDEILDIESSRYYKYDLIPSYKSEIEYYKEYYEENEIISKFKDRY